MDWIELKGPTLMREKYYWIEGTEDGCYIHEYANRAAMLKELDNRLESYSTAKFKKEFVDSFKQTLVDSQGRQTGYSNFGEFSGNMIFKGEIVCPTPVETVIKFGLE